MSDNNRRTLDFVSACLIGGAAGDALGAPVEFMSRHEILEKYGPEGITGYDKAYGRRGAVTDDTQMTLFTAEGLVISDVRGERDPKSVTAFVYHAYLRWLSTQRAALSEPLLSRHGTCALVDGHLMSRPELHHQRAPGRSCLTALMSGRMGTAAEPINDSKGCGGVMRVAPAGYFFRPESVFDAGCGLAAITHGHPSGYLAAGCLAEIISRISFGASLPEAAEESLRILETYPGHEECRQAVQSALDAWRNRPVHFETVSSLGEGWIAEEALGMSLYCALAADGDFDRGLRLAVNHGGDSDSTGAVTGNLLGALLGMEAIPRKYLHELELMDILEELAADLWERMPENR